MWVRSLAARFDASASNPRDAKPCSACSQSHLHRDPAPISSYLLSCQATIILPLLSHESYSLHIRSLLATAELLAAASYLLSAFRNRIT